MLIRRMPSDQTPLNNRTINDQTQLCKNITHTSRWLKE
jgi:hypothetical protein